MQLIGEPIDDFVGRHSAEWLLAPECPASGNRLVVILHDCYQAAGIKERRNDTSLECCCLLDADARDLFMRDTKNLEVFADSLTTSRRW